MKLLVVSHDASRTGAPLVLLTFLRWVRQETDSEVQLVLWRGGPLVPDFEEVAEVTVLHPPPGVRSWSETVELGLGEVGLGAVGRRLTAARVRSRLRVRTHDVALYNGAGSALVLPHLRAEGPALAYVHELARGLAFSLTGPGRDRFLGAARVAVVSRAVHDVLVADWGVPKDRIVLRPGCLPEPARGRGPAPARSGPLVASVGAGSWRKGVDLFVQVVAGVRRRCGADVRFAWVGPLDDEQAVRADVAALGLQDVLDLPGEVTDPGPWYEAMTLFCSTAREDPFPLVALEAGAASVPIVAFASGGIADLLADERGTVVGALDVAGMVDQVVAVLADPAAAAARAERLRAHVAAHHTVEHLGPDLWADLEAARATGAPP